jgi:hypothetical protein
MRIERLGFEVRERTPWEAIDLGVALARRHIGLWLPAWALAAGLLLAVLLGLGHGLGLMAWVPLALWWLKPALDRLPLYVLSRAVFGHAPTRAEVLRAALRWGWGPTLPRLLWLRFDPFRALSLPSDLLEGLPRRDRPRRRQRLRREGAAQAVALWFVLPLFELVLVFGSYALVALLIPGEWWAARGGQWLEALAEDQGLMAFASSLVACLALLCVEPFFVAAGFGLYLSRRVHLEAWDLELGFKRMAARAATLATLLLVLLGPASALAVGRATLPPEFRGSDAAVERLHEALLEARDHPTLGGETTAREWRAKRFEWPRAEPAAEDPFGAWLEALGRLVERGLSLGAAGLLWGLALALLAGLLWRFRDWLPWRREAAAGPPASPPLRHRALAPEDVAAAPELLARARAAWARGAVREAFASLYRAGLQEVSRRRPRPLPPGTTEGQLLRAAAELEAAAARRHVQRLVAAWRRVAYAGARPDEAEFHALLVEWPRAFGAEGRP